MTRQFAYGKKLTALLVGTAIAACVAIGAERAVAFRGGFGGFHGGGFGGFRGGGFGGFHGGFDPTRACAEISSTASIWVRTT
jgi:hypothetical protein